MVLTLCAVLETLVSIRERVAVKAAICSAREGLVEVVAAEAVALDWSKRSLVGARVERGFINIPMLCPLYLWPNIGFDVMFFKNRHDKEGVEQRPIVGGGCEHVSHPKFTPIEIGVVNHRMNCLRVLLGESGVIELPELENPCQNIKNESKHGAHGSIRRAPLLGSGYEVSNAHFLQESGLIEPCSFFSNVEPEILSILAKPGENLNVLLIQIDVHSVDVRDQSSVLILFQVRVESSNKKGLIIDLLDVEEIEEVSTFEDNPCFTWNGVMNEAGGGESGRENFPMLKLFGEPHRLFAVVEPKERPVEILVRRWWRSRRGSNVLAEDSGFWLQRLVIDYCKADNRLLRASELWKFKAVGADSQLSLRSFPATLDGLASEWFNELPEGKIDSWEDLARRFLVHFAGNRKKKLHFSHLLLVRQRPDEPLREFLPRWKLETTRVYGADDKTKLSTFHLVLRSGDFSKLLALEKPREYSIALAMAEDEAEAEELETNKKKEEAGRLGPILMAAKPTPRKVTIDERPHLPAGHRFRKGRDPRDRRSFGKDVYEEGAEDMKPYPPEVPSCYSQMSLHLLHILFHRAAGHYTDACKVLKREIETLIQAGYLRQFVKKKNTWRKDDGKKAADNRGKKPAGTQQKKRKEIGLPRDIIDSEGLIEVMVTFSDGEHKKTIPVEFMVVRLLGSHNLILGRPALEDLDSVTSVKYLCMKFPTDSGVGVCREKKKLARLCYQKQTKKMDAQDLRVDRIATTLLKEEEGRPRAEPAEEIEDVVIMEEQQERKIKLGTNISAGLRSKIIQVLRENFVVFAWSVEDMPGVSKSLITHHLAVGADAEPVKQRRRHLSKDRRDFVKKEVDMLQAAGHVKEIKYPTWNPTASNRVIKWSVYLSQYQIEMKPRTAIKAQALVDFMVEYTARDNNPTPTAEQGEWWTLSTDGSSAAKACGGGVVIQSPEGFRSYHAIKFQFKVSNNEAEYEALLSGLRIILNLKAEYVRIRCDSRLVVNQIKGEFDTKEERMRLYKEAALELLKILKGYERVQIPRVESTEADVLSKLSNDSPEHISKMAHIEDLGSPSIHVQFISVITKEINIDNGTQFEAGDFNELLQDWKIKHTYSSVAYPQGNGQVENANRTIMDGIKKRLESYRGAWVDQLPNVLWAYRTTPRRATGETPFSMCYGVEARAPSEVFIPTWREENYEAQENEEAMTTDLHFIEECREKAFLRAKNYRRQVKEYYDRKVRTREFQVGDLVLRKREASQPTEGGKFAKSYEGPYKVTAVLRLGTYKLSTLEGRELGRHWNTHNLISLYL
ncbi:unnamed protein product [Cuscuta campestris]|uniref:Integrase catalytic domain-containing protein n=1 Tax=Cuscuta campestris TaxID=132261 RepID=A0A484MHQ0_9ASTE|nr:unnamed protein product [Cuscuta campestris]